MREESPLERIARETPAEKAKRWIDRYDKIYQEAYQVLQERGKAETTIQRRRLGKRLGELKTVAEAYLDIINDIMHGYKPKHYVSDLR